MNSKLTKLYLKDQKSKGESIEVSALKRKLNQPKEKSFHDENTINSNVYFCYPIKDNSKDISKKSGTKSEESTDHNNKFHHINNKIRSNPLLINHNQKLIQTVNDPIDNLSLKMDNDSKEALINEKRLQLQEEYIRMQNIENNAISFLDSELGKLKNSLKNNDINCNSKSKVRSERESNSNDLIIPVYCSKTYYDLPGIDSVIHCFNRLLPFLKDKQAVNHFKIPISKGIILNGSTGCGKSSLIEAVSNEHKLILYRVYATQFMNALTGQSEKYIKKVFKVAMDSKKDCMLLIEDVDILFKKGHSGSTDSLEDRIVHQIASCMDELTTGTYINPNNNNLVCVVLNTCHISAIDPILRRSGRFEHEIHIGIPNVTTREAILKGIIKHVPQGPDVNITEIARITPGFVASDLCAIVRGAVINAYNRCQSVTNTIINENTFDSTNDMDNISTGSMVSMMSIDSVDCKATLSNQQTYANSSSYISLNQEDLIVASRLIKPASMKEGFTDVTGVTWEDIGALDQIQEELKLQIMGPILHKELFDSYGYTPSTGILLFGPPGCGKTLVAKALASEAGLNFISVRGPEIVSMYVGESERTLRDIFSQAQNSAPCVIFFDEIDSICVKRSDSSNDNNSSARLVNQLLTEMDGLIKRENVYILGATNRPDILDPAVLRPGRFDKLIYVGLPNDNERLSIINTITKNGTRPRIASSLINEIVIMTKNFTGADIVAFIRECTLIALKSALGKAVEKKSQFNKDYSNSIELEHLHNAQKKVKSSISSSDLLKYKEMKEKFSTLI